MKQDDILLLKANCAPVASTLKVLAHPQRLLVLCQLAEGEKTVGEIQELCALSQSYTSQFLIRMRRENLVVARKEGNFTYYRISDPKVLKLMQALKTIYCPE